MSALVNRIKRGFYADSVALMRIAREVAALKGVLAASLMIGTPSNRALLADSGLLSAEGRGAQPDDLVIAVRATGAALAARAADAAEERLAGGAGADARPGIASARGLDGALVLRPDANVALISVPGEYAAAEARRALERGLHVMLFSDNVSVEDEIELKQLAVKRGLLMMGPDCGTSHLGGTPLAFANVVPRGDVGLVSASGTGLQEVMCLVARGGGGVSHGIGVGGRDLSAEVGALMTLAAFDALDADAATRTIVLISKPPSPDVARKVFARVARSRKRVVLCLLGGDRIDAPRNAVVANTLYAAAQAALGRRAAPRPLPVASRAGWLRALYCGGTLCSEAQLLLRQKGYAMQSNVPVTGVAESSETDACAHSLLDLGDDAYTRGRPHPMIDPDMRGQLLEAALREPGVSVVLLDVVLGYGAHPDPAGLIAQSLARVPRHRARVIASVTGTDGDPQGHAAQVARLRAAGVLVAVSNVEAVLTAARALKPASSVRRSSRGRTAPGSAGTRRRRAAPAGRSAGARRGKR
ncbi:MAG: acyl-CoA synthetase FdrA [Betaproteobacteria bacterium]|nr:acyl-CoA synthetase FdrA [Betaproteobacteria bacterium]